MGIVINTNAASNNAQRHLSITSNALATSIERLSSGLRINHAADDAASLSIAQKLEGQVRGTAQGQRNAQDGISLLQTADGALDEVHTILQRMRELAVQGANDTLTCDDRQAIVTELTQLGNELDAIRSQTTFNTKLLLDGSFSGTFQVGPDCGQTLAVDLSGAKVDSATLGVGATTAPTSASANGVWTAMIATVDIAITSISTSRATIGADQNRLESIVRRLGVANENMNAAESRIRDADMAKESVSFNKSLILQQAGISVLAQANTAPNQVIRLLQ